MSEVWTDHGQGRQSCRMGAHLLEIKRNPDPHDRRRYVAFVDREEVPTPTWSPSQAKIKAVNALRRGFVTVRGPRRADEFADSPADPEPQLPEVYARFTEAASESPDSDLVRFEVKGQFDLSNFSGSMSALHSAVELLREIGPTVCDVYPPGKISL